MIAGVDHVQVAAPAGCEDAARAFYGGLLGMEEMPKPEALRPRGGVWFRAGDQELHVGVEQPFAPARKAHPALALSGAAGELDALAERLSAAGHTVQRETGRFHTADPFGNRLELVAGPPVVLRPLRDDERPWALRILRESWGTEITIYSDGREFRPAELPGFVAEAGDEPSGVVTYAIDGETCELVTLNALQSGRGVGGALVEAVADAARAAGCARLHLITTNDNLPALRLYQRHGFALVALNAGAIDAMRARKPEISATGHAGVPIRDELELERIL
jgi:ribosomal protein S18 acetylase RimI-like enzyme